MRRSSRFERAWSASSRRTDTRILAAGARPKVLEKFAGEFNPRTRRPPYPTSHTLYWEREGAGPDQSTSNPAREAQSSDPSGDGRTLFFGRANRQILSGVRGDARTRTTEYSARGPLNGPVARCLAVDLTHAEPPSERSRCRPAAERSQRADGMRNAEDVSRPFGSTRTPNDLPRSAVGCADFRLDLGAASPLSTLSDPVGRHHPSCRWAQVSRGGDGFVP